MHNCCALLTKSWPGSRSYPRHRSDILDAYDGYGLIAVGTSACSQAAGGIAGLPEVAASADSPARIHIVLAGCVPLALVTAGAWYARRRLPR